jgi:DDE superfamily endonuclease
MLPRSFCITPSGKVHALVKDRHRSREFFEFLKLLDAAYPASTAIKLILDNRAAHISKETKASVAAKPAHPFEFTFNPKHDSWLNLIEAFSPNSPAPSCHIRVASKHVLKDRIRPPLITSISGPSFTPESTSLKKRYAASNSPRFGQLEVMAK